MFSGVVEGGTDFITDLLTKIQTTAPKCATRLKSIYDKIAAGQVPPTEDLAFVEALSSGNYAVCDTDTGISQQTWIWIAIIAGIILLWWMS